MNNFYKKIPTIETVFSFATKKFCKVILVYVGSVDWGTEYYIEFWKNFMPWDENKIRIKYNPMIAWKEQTNDKKMEIGKIIL